MSGIAGIYYPDHRPLEPATLRAMTEIMAHRGPHAQLTWRNAKVGLGHAMLRNTPESLNERQPFVGHDGGLVITADARIDNREQLISDLGSDARPHDEITDSELILSAYAKWGEDSPKHLIGDFAFVIWDERRQLLFGARDQMGVKPFYYHHRSGQALVFASEIKALLEVPDVPRRLNETRIADFLGLQFEDKAITSYQDILRLPPAHSMTVGREGMEIREYWSLDPSRELKLGSNREYAGAFRDVFTEAVRCRVRSTGPVGSLLSGGLDSSSITCMARDVLPRNGNNQLHSFSAVFDRFVDADERPFINAVVAQGGIEAHYVSSDQISPLGDIDRMLEYQDEPFHAGNLCLNWALDDAARGEGVSVLLDGLLGDAIVSHGLEHLPHLARTGRWPTFITETYWLTRRRRGGSWRSFWNYLWNLGIRPAAPQPLRGAWRALRQRAQKPAANSTVINAGLASRTGIEERPRALAEDRFQGDRTPREEHWAALTAGLFPTALEIADRAAAAFSIEPRYPYLDSRLVEFCLSLPPEQKLHRGWNRVVVRRALSDSLPREVRRRGDKGSFLTHFVSGLRTTDRERLDELILRDGSSLEPYMDMPTLLDAYRRFISGGDFGDALTIWTAAILALWLRRTGLTHEPNSAGREVNL